MSAAARTCLVLGINEERAADASLAGRKAATLARLRVRRRRGGGGQRVLGEPASLSH